MSRRSFAVLGLVAASLAAGVLAQGGLPVVTPAPPTCSTPRSNASPPTGAVALPEATPPGCNMITAAPSIQLFDLGFRPDVVTIHANTPVVFALHNVGVALHNFSIDALHISVNLLPGERTTLIVETPPGRYTFYCDIPGHRAAGMVGTLIAR